MRRRIAALSLGLLLVLGIGGAAAPATAEPAAAETMGGLAYVQARVESYQTGRCLDSNRAGDVYTLPCNGGNNQRWDIWYGGWTRNVATGMCLVLRWNGEPFLRTTNCINDQYQFWYQWNGGWYQHYVVYAGGDRLCFESYKPWWEPDPEWMGPDNVASCAEHRPQFWGHRP